MDPTAQPSDIAANIGVLSDVALVLIALAAICASFGTVWYQSRLDEPRLRISVLYRGELQQRPGGVNLAFKNFTVPLANAQQEHSKQMQQYFVTAFLVARIVNIGRIEAEIEAVGFESRVAGRFQSHPENPSLPILIPAHRSTEWKELYADMQNQANLRLLWAQRPQVRFIARLSNGKSYYSLWMTVHEQPL